MNQVFADTSYWIALLNPRDELHEKALAVSKIHSEDRIVTSQMVLTELLNSFADRGSQLRVAVAKAVETLLTNRNVTTIPQTSSQFESALRKYRAAPDKGWSLTDCASFLIMEAEAIRAALTYDRHFEQAGFQAILR
jgi:predicted nucleic acid-binding protein